jgi:nucleotide-binding universal stress UspA family protein
MYHRILVAVDGSSTSRRALQEGLKLAADEHAHLLLVHVLDESALYRYPVPIGDALHPVLEAWRQGGQNVLNEASGLARQAGAEVEAELLESADRQIPEVIVDKAKRWEADLIVMGTHGRQGLEHLLLGSVAERVIRIAPVPVLLTRGADAAMTS